MQIVGDNGSSILKLSVFALFFCKACQAPLGMESGAISDAQISASSEWDPNHAAIQGRLNFKAGGGKQGGWSSRHNNQNQRLQVDLGSSKEVTYFATQGRNAVSQWVTSYKVEYSNDGSSFQYYQEQGADKVCELFYTSLLFDWLKNSDYEPIVGVLRHMENSAPSLKVVCSFRKL